MLARALAKPSNLLVLDEPTNDLDLETLDLLEEMLGRLPRHRDPGQPRPRLPRPRRDLPCSCPKATGAGPNMPAATPTCWRSAAPTLPAAKRRRRQGREQAAQAAEAAARRRSRQGASSASTTSTRWRRCPSRSRRCRTRSRSLQQRLDDPGLYARDPKAFADVSAALAATRSRELAAAEERWLELEMLREEIEG